MGTQDVVVMMGHALLEHGQIDGRLVAIDLDGPAGIGHPHPAGR